MSALSASDAKREFGEVLLKAQKAPVKINKNGKPVAVVVSAVEYEQLEAYRDEYLKAEIEAGIADLDAGNVSEGVEVLKRLRKRIT
ncbi:MAG: type II toxin-antitoxin system prevent-host-death family antitoxin [Gammaproteobacteria bacterium]|nr:type II toxin-antitoxin system prevent-host-death family antitoxin [Gammaproteobacteria bacterium]